MKKGNVFIATGLLLIAAALLLTCYNMWDNSRAGKTADVVLSRLAPKIGEPVSTKQDTPDVPADEIEYPDYVLNPDMPMPTETVSGLDYIGILDIPLLGLRLPVLADWSYPNLKIGPCRYSGSAYLDDMVICAHNYGVHFGSLRHLSYGDTVIFTDMDGNVFSYRVAEMLTLQPTNIEEMTAGDWDLTLFTCTVGGATRVTVRCEKAE